MHEDVQEHHVDEATLILLLYKLTVLVFMNNTVANYFYCNHIAGGSITEASFLSAAVCGSLLIPKNEGPYLRTGFETVS